MQKTGIKKAPAIQIGTLCYLRRDRLIGNTLVCRDAMCVIRRVCGGLVELDVIRHRMNRLPYFYVSVSEIRLAIASMTEESLLNTIRICALRYYDGFSEQPCAHQELRSLMCDYLHELRWVNERKEGING